MSVFSYSRFMTLSTVFGLMLVFSPLTVYAENEEPVIVDSDFIDGIITTPDDAALNSSDGDAVSASAAIDEGSASESSFFDADDLVPQGEMGRKGPINVDPVTQPASKFIIVKRNSTIDKKEVSLISAERAMSLGRFDSALLMFDSLYERSKKDARILMGRAVSLQEVGRFDEAMQMYEELSVVAPDNIDAKINMLGLLGTRYPSIALRKLLDLHAGNKSNTALTAQIAVAYAKTGDARSALSYLGLAASMDPENANHVFNMAVISDRAGDEKLAVSYYEKALEVDTVYGAGRSIPRDIVYERLAQIR